MDSEHEKDIIAFAFLSIFLLVYFFSLFIEPTFPMLLIAVIASLVLTKGLDLLHKIPSHKLYGFLEHKTAVLACVIGAVATYLLSVNLNLGPALAASIVGATGALGKRLISDVDFPPAIYCGAFAGMVSPLILSSIPLVGVAGLAAGLIYYIAHETFTGVGGKLGTIAFCGVALSVLAVRIIGGML